MLHLTWQIRNGLLHPHPTQKHIANLSAYSGHCHLWLSVVKPDLNNCCIHSSIRANGPSSIPTASLDYSNFFPTTSLAYPFVLFKKERYNWFYCLLAPSCPLSISRHIRKHALPQDQLQLFIQYHNQSKRKHRQKYFPHNQCHINNHLVIFVVSRKILLFVASAVCLS